MTRISKFSTGSSEIDSFTVDVLDTIDHAAEATLTMPVYKSNQFKSNNDILPGWNTLVKPSKNDAGFWHNIWISAGRPLNNNLHKNMKHTRNIYHYNLRKCKKSQDQIKRNKLLNACLNGNGEIFSEIKKIRQCKPVFPSSIDGVSNDVPNHFKNIYSKLYNSIDDTDELFAVKTYVDLKITIFSAYDVEKVTPEVVKQAAAKLKDGKSDPIFKFSTDCIKNAPDILFRHLAAIFRSYLYHGHMTTFLLLATLMPIVKDKLASINNSKNYRSIAISSLLLKLIDWVALILFGKTIGLDDLQCAYQGGASTSMCTWAVMETIGYFLRNGVDVFTCQTDMTKAFDLVRHSLLFRKIVDSFFPLIFIRLFIYIYSFQYANVRWNSNLSDIFSLCDGVRQGAVLSGILYCFYVNSLFQLLRRKTTGCWINGQEMMITIETYCTSHSLKFSTDPNPLKCKTKCIAFLKKNRTLPQIVLNGNNLPWVFEGVHLGNYFTNRYDGMTRDTKMKRGQFISRNYELLQEFYFAHPSTKLQTVLLYNCHFTGSPIWDIFSPEVDTLSKSWNIAMRKVFDLPMTTHRYLLEPISENDHLLKILIERFISFISQLEKSSKNVVKQL